MATPAVKTMENQVILEYRGTASGPPRRTLPSGDKIRKKQNSAHMLQALMKSQSNWVVIDTRRAPSTSVALSWKISAPITKASVTIPEVTNTGAFISRPNI